MELAIASSKKDENSSFVNKVSEQVDMLAQQLKALTERPSLSNINHGISPLPSVNSDLVEKEILVSPPKEAIVLTNKEEIKIRKKVKHASKALKEEYEYSEITIENLARCQVSPRYTIPKAIS